MGLFDVLFGTTKKSEPGIEITAKPEEAAIPEIKEPNGANDGVALTRETELTVTMPLDEIYKYLRVDFESRGYDDAMSNPDTSYRDMNKQLIVSNLKVLFKQIKQIYIDNLKTTDFHIKSREQAGLIDIVE